MDRDHRSIKRSSTFPRRWILIAAWSLLLSTLILQALIFARLGSPEYIVLSFAAVALISIVTLAARSID